MKKILEKFFVKAMSGYALGLFPTLIAGTILEHIGTFLITEEELRQFGQFLISVGFVVKGLTGVGIGLGVALKLNAESMAIISAVVAGFIGEHSVDILGEGFTKDKVVDLDRAGLPLCALMAAFVAVELVSVFKNRKRFTYIYVPVISITAGTVVAFFVAKPVNAFLESFCECINYGTKQEPFFMGIIVSVLMGFACTFPMGSLAIISNLKLSNLALGAAAIGCCSSMVGFAAASYRENKMEGFVLQSIGTSALQLPNIFRKPIIYLPILITNGLLGGISTKLIKLTCDAEGAGLGSCGLVAPISTFVMMTTKQSVGREIALLEVCAFQFILPTIIAWFLSEFLRKHDYIKDGDMKINL